MKLFTYYLPIGLLLGIVLISIYFLYLVLQPFTPPTVNPLPLPVLNPNHTVYYGQSLQTRAHSCVHQVTPVMVSTRYEDSQGRIYYFTTTDTITHLGCTFAGRSRTPIPSTLPPGIYTAYITADFVINPVKDVIIQYPTEKFYIKAKP